MVSLVDKNRQEGESDSERVRETVEASFAFEVLAGSPSC